MIPQDLPGVDLVEQGVKDLARGEETVPALLVSIGAYRMRLAGLDVPEGIEDSEHRLYRMLGRKHGNAAPSQYNALIRRMVSFERALECAS